MVNFTNSLSYFCLNGGGGRGEIIIHSVRPEGSLYAVSLDFCVDLSLSRTSGFLLEDTMYTNLRCVCVCVVVVVVVVMCDGGSGGDVWW